RPAFQGLRLVRHRLRQRLVVEARGIEVCGVETRRVETLGIQTSRSKADDDNGTATVRERTDELTLQALPIPSPKIRPGCRGALTEAEHGFFRRRAPARVLVLQEEFTELRIPECRLRADRCVL